MSEFNRRGRRNPIEGTAKISLGLFRSHICDIKDLSASGARLRVAADKKLPARFALKLAGFKRKRYCETRWREGDMIGVEFLMD